MQDIDKTLRSASIDAWQTTTEVFGTSTNEETLPFTKFAIACRSLTKPAHEELIKPLVNGILEDLGLNPVTSDEDRATCATMIDFFAMTVQDAASLVMQGMQREMQERARAEQAINSGNGHILKG